MLKPCTLVFLQNQWFHDPQRVRDMIANSADPIRLREMLIRRALFAGCHTGKVLERVFGEWVNEMHWDEASPEIGNRASAKFPADPDHMRKVIARVKPNVIVALGQIAATGLAAMQSQAALPPGVRVIIGPHPASRSGTTALWQTFRTLKEINDQWPTTPK